MDVELLGTGTCYRQYVDDGYTKDCPPLCPHWGRVSFVRTTHRSKVQSLVYPSSTYCR